MDGVVRACPFGFTGVRPGVAQPPGFRHFLGAPDRRFHWRGAEPRGDAAALDGFRRDMAVLGRALESAPEPAGKPRLPAGYTYALQLVAHDVVETSLPFWAAGPGSDTRNLQSRPLRLNTLYGAGADLHPPAAARDAGSADMPVAFRLGRVRAAPGEAEPLPSGRDIPRISTQPTTDADSVHGLNATLLADARNDLHVMLSQTTVLFMALHNALLDRLPPLGRTDLATRTRLAHARLGCVKSAVVLIYRAILRDDILPRILHPEVQALYARGAPLLESAATPPGLPLEFSHGAFRFAHAMAKGSYRMRGLRDPAHKMGAVLQRNSELLGNRFPQDATWVLDWGGFLPMEGEEEVLNMARPIGATSNPHFALDRRFGHLYGDIDSKGLALRDLMSGGLAGLWSVWSLREALMRNAALAPLLDLTPERCGAAVAAWGQALPVTARPSAEIMRGLTEDPPLAFFVLLEAGLETGHAGLGPLGSIIIAETLHGIMARDPLPAEELADDLPAQLAEVERMHGFAPGEARLPAIHSLPGLLRFLSAEPQWRDAFPPLFSPPQARTA